MNQSEIINFFKNQTLFLTGGTGFLGKVLVEKILRVCEIKKLYLLVRPKKGKSVEERFDDYFNTPCFKNLQIFELKEKVVFVNGDCEKPNLGLSEENKNMLIDETNIVIHAAANVKFDQPLRVAATMNVGGTIEILALAKKMSQLKVFVYVSTAFSNCPNLIIDEKCYPPPMTPKQLFSLLKGIPDDNILDKITPKILKKWPNTYCFTKSITEYHLNQEGKSLPICITRPTIVLSSLQEPMPGWTDNFYGPCGIAVAGGLGIVRNFHANLDVTTHFVPCDYVCNTILAATWNTAIQKCDSITFYNTFATEKNSINWRKFSDLVETHGLDHIPEKAVWYYCFKMRENFIWYKICVFFQHTLVAYIADFVLICIRREPLAVKNYAKLDKLMSLTSYFTVRNWTFISNNTHALWEKMNDRDKQLFAFNMDHIDWSLYFLDCVKGGRIYLLKDPLESIPNAKRRMRYLRVAHYTFLALLYFLLFILLKFIGKTVLNMF